MRGFDVGRMTTALPMLASLLDRRHKRVAEMSDLGIRACWDSCHLLSKSERARCFESASRLIEHFIPLLDRQPSTHEVVWRFATFATGASLKMELERNLSLSKKFELSGDVALWVTPTLAQFCFGSEILRRKMRTAEGQEVARAAGRLASYKIGCLHLGQMSLK